MHVRGSEKQQWGGSEKTGGEQQPVALTDSVSERVSLHNALSSARPNPCPNCWDSFPCKSVHVGCSKLGKGLHSAIAVVPKHLMVWEWSMMEHLSFHSGGKISKVYNPPPEEDSLPLPFPLSWSSHPKGSRFSASVPIIWFLSMSHIQNCAAKLSWNHFTERPLMSVNLPCTNSRTNTVLKLMKSGMLETWTGLMQHIFQPIWYYFY